MKKAITAVLPVFFALWCRAQEFQINKPCPDFVIKNISGNQKSAVSIKDLKDKWIILDFFASSCTVCFQSLPKINNLQKEYGDKLTFILIGNEDGKIRTVYEKFKKKFDLQLSVAYDSSLFRKFKISVVPYYVWIDQEGMIRAISFPEDVTNENIAGFLSNKPIRTKTTVNKTAFDPTQLFMQGGNGSGDTGFLFRSIFSRWNPSMQKSYPPSIEFMERPGSFQVLGADLASLFNYAYFGAGEWNSRSPQYGNVFPKPIFQSASSEFTADYKTGANIYCYSLTVPPAFRNKYMLQQYMQNDLKNYFGFSARVVVQNMPCWKLVMTNEARRKLKTRGGAPKRDFSLGGLSYKNVSIAEIIDVLNTRFQHYPPFVNATEMDSAIDIEIDAVLTDFEDFKEGLQKNGLDLVLSEKEMQVLILEIHPFP